MKTRRLTLSLVAGVFYCLFVAGVQAATCTWDGGGSDDNLTTAANWDGDAAPEAGDTLVFQGETRTSPVNDFPAGTSFSQIQFANDGSSGKTAGFTLSGNAMTLTEQNAIATVSSSAAITDTLALDLSVHACVNMGTDKAEKHALTFSGAVTGAGGNRFGLAQQFAAQVKVTGKLSGFTGVNRPNNANVLWLTNPNNDFTSPTKLLCGEGTLKLDCAGAAGSAEDITIELGQAQYTTATLSLNATSDQYLKAKLMLTAPNKTDYIRNENAGTTWTIEGDVETQSLISDEKSLLKYVGMNLQGAGNGVIRGNLVSPETELYKADAGIWTWEGSSVGLRPITVSGGTLFLDGDWSSHTNVSLTSVSAAIGGTGTVSRVSFAYSSQVKLSPYALDTDGLRVTGPVRLLDYVYVTADAATVAEMTPGVEYTVMTWNERQGPGLFALDSNLSGVTLVEHANSIALVKGGDARVWKGDAGNNVWDKSTANWQGGLTYADGNQVTFDNTADDETESVTVGAVVAPSVITVSGTRNYSFSGAKITGLTGIAKSGSSVLTLESDNDFTGTIGITEGAVVQNGTLDGATVFVNGGAFTNAASALLTGSASVLAHTGTVTLKNPNNDFTGGLRTLDKPQIYAATLSALGKGEVNIWSGTGVYIEGGGSSWPEATLVFGGGSIRFLGNTAATWVGDIVLPEVYSQSSLTLHTPNTMTVSIGTPGGTSTVRSYSNKGIYTTGASATYNWYSHILIGENGLQQTNGHTTHLYHEDNEIGILSTLQGTVVCHARNAIGYCEVALSQRLTGQYAETPFYATLNLNGFDQTIRSIRNIDVAKGTTRVTQLIRSDTPCVLTVSNDTDHVTLRYDGALEGAITLVKAGEGNWTTYEKNSTTGDVIVAQGTLTLAASDVLARGTNSRLSVEDGAYVGVESGIVAEVPRLTLGGKSMSRGTYGGEGCAVAGARIMSEYFAAGEGAVKVTGGEGNGLYVTFTLSE